MVLAETVSTNVAKIKSGFRVVFSMLLGRWEKFWRWVISLTPLSRYANGEIWMKYSTWQSFLQLTPDFNGTIADLGCGVGSLCLWLAKEYPRATIVGIDVNCDAVRRAEENRNTQGLQNLRFSTGSVMDLPFADNSLDKIISTQVWEHLSPPMDRRMFEEVFRVLKPDGDFVLNTPGPLFYTYRFPIYRISALLFTSMRLENKTLSAYCRLGAYDAWNIHGHVRPGFEPVDVFRRLPPGISPVTYKYTLKHLGAKWFELTSLNRNFRNILLPFSYLFFWIDDHLPGKGFDLSIRFKKLEEPRHKNQAPLCPR